jgi:hypothetical protein
MKQKIKNEIIKILNDCDYWQPKMIIAKKEPFFWEINPDWLEDKSNRLSELFEKQKQEIVEEIDYNTLEGIICKQLGQYSEFNQLPNWDNIGKKSVVYDLIEVIKTHLKQTLTK